MKIFRATAAVAFVAAICVGSVRAQQPRPGTTTPPPGPAPTVNVPDSKIALVNSDEFNDEKTGIVRVVNAMKKVDGEFTAKRKELQDLQAQIEKATADLNKAAAMQDPKVTQQQQDKIDQMKKDYQRKGEDGTAAFNKRLQEVAGPIWDDIGKALEAYAQAHGITLLVDVPKLVSVDPQGHQQFPLLYFAPSIDITRAFINDYNTKNPATASLTPPK